MWHNNKVSRIHDRWNQQTQFKNNYFGHIIILPIILYIVLCFKLAYGNELGSVSLSQGFVRRWTHIFSTNQKNKYSKFWKIKSEEVTLYV